MPSLYGHRAALFVWGFAVAVAYVPWLPSHATFGRWWVITVGAIALLFTVRIHRTPGHWLFVALIAWMALGLGWSVSRWDTAGELLKWTALLAAFCVAAEVVDITPLFAGMGVGLICSAVVAVAQALGHAPVWQVYDNRFFTLMTPVGLFVAKSQVGDTAALVAILCARRRLWPLAVVAAALFVAAEARASYLAVLVAVVVFLWTDRPAWRWVIAATSGIVASALVVIAVHGALGLFRDRLDIWRFILPHVTWHGDGLNSLAVAATGLEFAHNEFLHYAFELGIGSAFLWGIFAYALWSGPSIERAAVAGLLALCGVLYPLHEPVPAFVGAALAGHLCGHRRRAVLLERARGVAGALGLFDEQPSGVGALQPADHRRLFQNGLGGADLHATAGGGEPVSAGPSNPVVTRAVRPTIRARWPG